MIQVKLESPNPGVKSINVRNVLKQQYPDATFWARRSKPTAAAASHILITCAWDGDQSAITPESITATARKSGLFGE
jgi:hypothetical protein